MVPIINLLQLGLDGASRRQEAISNNIANVDTPNYKREDVQFIDRLRQVMDSKKEVRLNTTSDKHIDSSNRKLRREQGFNQLQSGNMSYRNDQNNVDIDAEMALMAKNNLYYNTLSQQIGKKFSGLNNVIEKGGR